GTGRPRCARRPAAARRWTRVGSCEIEAAALRGGMHVLVAAAGEIDVNGTVLRHRRRDARGMRQRVARLERRQDAFDAAAVVEGGERLVVVDDDVLRTPGVLQPCVLRTDAG